MGTYALPEERIKSYAIFSIANGAAFIAGLPIGGILIDNVGFFYTFLLCFVVSAASILYSYTYIKDYDGFKIATNAQQLVNPFKIGKIPGLASAILCLGFPVRFLYTALIPVFEPLFLESLGNSMSVIGRVMMIFGILMFCLSPITHVLVGFFKKTRTSMSMCVFLLIAALLYQFNFPTTLGASVAIALLSIGLVVHMSSIMAILEEIAAASNQEDARGSVIGLYFTYERIAMVCGPLVTSFLIGYAGYEKTLLILAIFLAITHLMYYVLNFKKYNPLQGAQK